MSKRQPFKFSIRKVADVSTFHVTKADGKILGYIAAPCHVARHDPIGDDPIGDDSPGDFYYVPSDMRVLRDKLMEMKVFGFSFQFRKLFLEAHQQKIHYICFDRDGDEVGGAPKEDW